MCLAFWRKFVLHYLAPLTIFFVYLLIWYRFKKQIPPAEMKRKHWIVLWAFNVSMAILSVVFHFLSDPVTIKHASQEQVTRLIQEMGDPKCTESRLRSCVESLYQLRMTGSVENPNNSLEEMRSLLTSLDNCDRLQQYRILADINRRIGALSSEVKPKEDTTYRKNIKYARLFWLQMLFLLVGVIMALSRLEDNKR